jgi:hypothetical protein
MTGHAAIEPEVNKMCDKCSIFCGCSSDRQANDYEYNRFRVQLDWLDLNYEEFLLHFLKENYIYTLIDDHHGIFV